MKIKFIALLFIATCFNVHKLTAQTDSTSVIKNSIGISLSPMLCMPIDGAISPYSTPPPSNFSYAAGISSNLVVSKKHKLFIGIDLTYAYCSVTQKNIPNLITLNSFGGTAYAPRGYFSMTSKYNFICLAPSIQKVIAKLGKKVFLFGGIGMQFNYNIALTQSTQNHLDYSGNNIDYTTHQNGTGGNNLALAAFAKVGVMANLTNRLSFFAAPVFYYDLNPKIIFRHNNTEFNNLGLNLQLMYCF